MTIEEAIKIFSKNSEQERKAMEKKLNISALENIVDIAMLRFNLKPEDRKDIACLFMAYTGEVLKQTCYSAFDSDAYKELASYYAPCQCCCKPED